MLKQKFFALTLVSAAGMASVAFADAYVWTGAEDGFWTNRANWTLNGEVPSRAPGVPFDEMTKANDYYWDASDEAKARKGEDVEFGAVAPGAATTIDLDGLFCIHQVTVKANAPAYTFGTSSSQVLSIEAGTSAGTGGSFILEEGLETLPTMTACFSPGGWSTGTTASADLVNNTGKELVLNDIAWQRYVGQGKTYGYLETCFKGTGTYRIKGGTDGLGASFNPLHVFDIYAPKVTITSENRANRTFNYMWHIQFYSDRSELEIPEGTLVATRDGGSSPAVASIDGSGRLTGSGTLRLYNYSISGGTINAARLSVNAGRTLEIAAPIDFIQRSGTQDDWLYIRGGSSAAGGRICLTGPAPTFTYGSAPTPGGYVFEDNGRTLASDLVERFGAGPLVFTNNGTLACGVATNATLAKEFRFTTGGKTATVANEGAGTLTVEPTVVVQAAGTELALEPTVSPIVLGTVAVTKAEEQMATLTVKSGPAAVKFVRAESLAAFDALRLTGGTVELGCDVGTAVTFDTAETLVLVPDGTSLSLGSLAATAGKAAGTLNFVTRTGKVSVADTSAVLPAGVRLNGYAAMLDTDGTVIAAVDRAIGAKGDVVPDAATEVVGIVRAGTDGNDTIESDVTSVRELAQHSGTDATVEIGEGRKLALGKVKLGFNAGSLTLGTLDDLGTVDAPMAGGSIWLANQDAESELTVRAAIADGAEVRVNGTVKAPVVAGGTAGDCRFVVSRGELVMSGTRPFSVDRFAVGTNVSQTTLGAVPTLRIDGARDVRLGTNACYVGDSLQVTGRKGFDCVGRLVVTNALVRNVDVDRTAYEENLEQMYDDGAIRVGRGCAGILEIQDGALVSNRLIVGAGSWDASYGLSIGTVLQTGGEMVALSSTTYHRGSGVGGSGAGFGYYELAGGRFTILGNTMIGGTGYGYFHQTGGTFSVLTHPNAPNGGRTIYLGATNSGQGQMYVEGGKVECGSVAMNGAYYTSSGKASLILDNDAEMDLGSSAVNVVNTSYSCQGQHESTVSLNGSSRLRAWSVYQSFIPSADKGMTLGLRKTALNFNGGTFVPSADNLTIFGKYSTMAPVQHIVVYPGGMKIDTDRKKGTVIEQDLEGVAGDGVASVDISGLDIPDLTCAPYVAIEGDGTGAVAVAVWDSATWKLKGIKVINPGVNYKTATAQIRIVSGTYAWDAPCTLGANANTGSFTKTGDGDLTLKGTNTYGGATILAGGVLKVAGEKAIPGTTIAYRGGSLEVTSAGKLPSAFSVDVGDPETVHKCTLATFAEAPEELPAVTVVGGNPQEWKTVLVGRELRVRRAVGSLLIVR